MYVRSIIFICIFTESFGENYPEVTFISIYNIYFIGIFTLNHGWATQSY